MLIISGSYYDNSDIDTPDESKTLFINSASHYILKTSPRFGIIRADGRRDWQLIYVKYGVLHYKYKNENRICQNDSIIIFSPNVTQHYYFDLSDNPDIYIVNFTGSGVKTILHNLSFHHEAPIFVSESENYTHFLDSIIFELQQKNKNYISISALYFELLLSHFSRGYHIEQSNSMSLDKIVADAMLKMNSAISQPFDIENFAHTHNISSNWFTRLFKQQIGVSPHKYLINLRMERAKSLIKSDMSIQDISKMVGYDDSFYFSRLFKSTIGISPTEYRKNQLKLLAMKPNMLSWTFTGNSNTLDDILEKKISDSKKEHNKNK